MRRPAPLPTSQEQESDPDVAIRPRRVRSERTPKPVRDLEEAPSAAVTVGDVVAPPGDDPLAGEAEIIAPMTNRDVWRAARARRRTLRAEIRRFTQRSRRRRWVWLGSVGAVVLLIGGSLITAYSPLFAVEKITVVGVSALDPAAVEAALSDQIGTPLALVDASEVKAALLAFPLIETYALEARPPHDLTLRIVERTPVGVIRSDAGFTLVDAAGVALSTTPEQPAGQPLLDVEGGVGSRAFESVGLAVRSLPAELRATLATVTATTQDDVTFTLTSGVTVVWGSADESMIKAKTLAASMAANPDSRHFDVSAEGVVGFD